MAGKKDGEIRYLNPPTVEVKRDKYCRFQKYGIKFIDYKDPDYLLAFINEQGKLLPRRLTGTSLKYQRKVAQAVKRARHLALMPYVADLEISEAMEIILKKDVDNVGYKNDLVTVKDGYARNFLVPQGMAVIATASAKKVREEDLRQRAHREAKLIEEATKLLKKIQDAGIKVGAKAGEGDKIFGSVNSIQVAEAIKAATGADVDRKKVGLKESTVKTLGKYTATVRLHKEVEGEFEFEVIAE